MKSQGKVNLINSTLEFSKDEVLTQINFYLCKNKLFVEEQTWGYPKYPHNMKSKTIDFKGIFG